MRRELFAKPISIKTLMRRINRMRPEVLSDALESVAIDHNLIGFYERVES